jgi:hypothetical protein
VDEIQHAFLQHFEKKAKPFTIKRFERFLQRFFAACFFTAIDHEHLDAFYSAFLQHFEKMQIDSRSKIFFSIPHIYKI